MKKTDKKIYKALKTGAPVMTEDSATAITSKISDIESRVPRWKLAVIMIIRILVIVFVLCAALLAVLLNVSDAAAEMMRGIPLIGGFVNLLKIR